MTAMYRLVAPVWDELVLPARMEYGVEFDDDSLDRFIVGFPEPDNTAEVIYYDCSNPWSNRIVSLYVFLADILSSPASVLIFDVLLTLSGLTPVGETEMIEGEVTLDLPSGEDLELDANYKGHPDRSARLPFWQETSRR